jgi:peptide/nickel transport system substrate-binding protein
MDKLVEAARFEADPKKYAQMVKGFIDMVYTDVPRVPVGQPMMDVAMRRNVQGYMYWFHLQPDYRQMFKQ